MPRDERLYFVTYDISDQRRWRRLFRIMKGYGKWLQLSVFQCRLSDRRHAEMIQLISGIIKTNDDHVVIVDVGAAADADPRVVSLGRSFETVEKGPIIV